MSDLNELSKEIYIRFGTVKRARKTFLYTAKGVRLTDMYQLSGRAILGWGGKGPFTIFKNVLERGLTGSFITDFSIHTDQNPGRLSKALSSLFGDERRAFIFNSKKEAIQSGLALSPAATSVYTPWNKACPDLKKIDCLLFAPTIAWGENIWLLAVKSEKVPEDFTFDNELLLPSPLCAALTRSVYDLIKALQERSEKDWFIYDQILCKYWERRGPYLYPKVPESKYSDFVLHCLDCNLVISPDYNQPSIVPFGADRGNFSKLKNNPFEYGE
ncbi:MAG: hypothetical protein K5873_01525 [Treponema sp.]|nr:hypothetical protein [Treponema sp.]